MAAYAEADLIAALRLLHGQVLEIQYNSAHCHASYPLPALNDCIKLSVVVQVYSSVPPPSLPLDRLMGRAEAVQQLTAALTADAAGTRPPHPMALAEARHLLQTDMLI